MLAYSSIAHAGYLLIPIVVGVEWGGMPVVFLRFDLLVS
jgi:NADH:ubiquinone oxidoreductase subunit 2 (subunit N)